MTTINRAAQLFGLAVFAALLLPSTAYAYVDAGTGSMMLQLLLAGAAGVLVLGKVFWQRIKQPFCSKKCADSKSADAEQSAEKIEPEN